MQLNPKIRPKDDFWANCEVFKLHIEQLMDNYGAVCCVNLIDRKKDQNTIGKYYNNIVQNYKDGNKDKANLLNFVWFDFHAECKKMKYENIKTLFKTNSFKEGLREYGFTLLKYNKENFDEDCREIASVRQRIVDTDLPIGTYYGARLQGTVIYDIPSCNEIVGPAGERHEASSSATDKNTRPLMPNRASSRTCKPSSWPWWPLRRPW